MQATQASDARQAWQQRDDKARDQEQAVLALAKSRNAIARDQRLNGEVVIRLFYKDGGVMRKKVETHEEVKE